MHFFSITSWPKILHWLILYKVDDIIISFVWLYLKKMDGEPILEINFISSTKIELNLVLILMKFSMVENPMLCEN